MDCKLPQNLSVMCGETEKGTECHRGGGDFPGGACPDSHPATTPVPIPGTQGGCDSEACHYSKMGTGCGSESSPHRWEVDGSWGGGVGERTSSEQDSTDGPQQPQQLPGWGLGRRRPSTWDQLSSAASPLLGPLLGVCLWNKIQFNTSGRERSLGR